jgi:diguanylate cyclase (GGDEF)-like protein
MIQRLPLRFLIPLLIMIGGGLIIASAWFFEMRAQVRSVLQVAEDQLRSNATFIAAEIEAAVRVQDFSEARAVLERAIAIPALRSIHLVEPDGTIRFSSNRRLIGNDFREQAATRAMERDVPFSAPLNLAVASDPKTSILIGRFPVQMRMRAAELMPIRSGALYLEYDLSSIVSEYRAALATRMLYRSGLLVAIAIGFWLLLRRWLLMRIDRLIASTRQVAQGRFDVDFDDRGHDELSDLALELRRMTQSLREQSQHLEYLADHDALTGLKNRTGIETAIETALRETRTCSTQFGLFLLDIDSLRVINDTQGHLAGDELLRSFAQLLTETLTEAVCIARVGGDEFAVLIDADHGEPLEAAGRRLQERIRTFRFERRGERFGVQATTGVIELSADLNDAEAALGAADAACYAAKDMERGGFVLIRSEDHRAELVESSMGLVSQIQDALDNDRFELFAQRIEPLQPLMEPGLHFEVLLRMIDRDGQPVAPGSFLAAAERYNLIGRIDRWVLRNTLAWLSSLGERVNEIEHCSINLSGASLGDSRLLGQFEDWLAAHPDFDPRLICFEVTETAAVRNLGRARTFIERMRRLGCRFALDDFGTGLSSFEYIKQLPVDLIKIDGIFVRGLLSEPADRLIVKAIHEIAGVLGIRTVAEFVENEAIADELRALGVDYGQGYGIGRPQPLSELFTPPPTRSELPGSRSSAG